MKVLCLLSVLCAVLVLMPVSTLAFNPRLRGLAEISEKELDRLLADEFELEFYIDCVLDRGSCDSNGRAIKDTLADMQFSHDVCQGCSKLQRDRAIKIYRTFQSKPIYDEILEKYNLRKSSHALATGKF